MRPYLFLITLCAAIARLTPAQDEPAQAPAKEVNQEQGRDAAVRELVGGPAFDRVFMKNRPDPLRVAPLPRPFDKNVLRAGQVLKLTVYRPDQAGKGPTFDM